MTKFKILLIAILSVYFMFHVDNLKVYGNEEPYIARWLDNKDAAISLRFDDSFESHVNIVIPLLNQHDFKATFMVNPMRKRHIRYKEFWEKEVPRMGHRLGNHTMHHKGANTLEEADFEIGEVSRIIWGLYPEHSKLLVFASGGGEKWGGEKWDNASVEYKKGLVKKYHLIDLYDGTHSSQGFNTKTNIKQKCEFVHKAIVEKKHQAFSFHDVGNPDIRDIVKRFIYGYGFTISKDKFSEFLKCVESVREQLWVAPLVQILKYEEEYNRTMIKDVEENETVLKTKLVVNTDPMLYDQKLTLIVPIEESDNIKKVMQDNEQIQDIHLNPSELLVNIKPISSEICVYYNID